MAGNDSFTKLLLHCNGTDGSTSFPDDSGSNHTVTANGNAQVDTAQSKFGGASSLYDGSNDYLSIPSSSEFNLDTSESWTIDFWIRLNSSQTNFQNPMHRGLGGAPFTGWQMSFDGSGYLGLVNNTDSTGGVKATQALSTDTWYHIAFVHDKTGDTLKIYIDGTEDNSATASTAITWSNVAQPLYIGSQQGFTSTRTIDGWMDEIRISKGVARWTSNFTPPTEEYSDVDVDASENLQVSDSIQTFDTSVIETENLEIADSIEVIDTTVQESEALQISDSIIVSATNTDAKFISKIISVNPLIFVTDTNPIEIIKVDTTDPENITWIVQTVPGISSAKDVAVNTTNDFIYIAGSAGQVVKVEIDDLANQTIIDLSDTDDLLTIETNSNYGLSYAGTENTTGELYLIDERDTFLLDSDFQAISQKQFTLDSDFRTVLTFKMDSDFQVLSQQTFRLDSDFKCLTKPAVTPPVTVNPLDTIEPIKLTDFQVFINSIELEDTDLILNSISITHSAGKESRASFELSRKHDQLNTTLEGVSSIITNQNPVEIRINGVTEFSGYISELNCQYQNEREYVLVNALAEEKTNQFNNITMSLPSLNSRLSLYDVLIQNPQIFNPVIDPDNEDNPKKFKGIRVDLGTEIRQRVTKFDIFDSTGSIAEEIQDGTFKPLQNWTYFWSPTVEKIDGLGIVNHPTDEALEDLDRDLPITERKPWLSIHNKLQEIFDRFNPDSDRGFSTNAIRFLYIGTSLAPVTEDLWDLQFARHWRQRIFENDEEELGFYEVGEAPFQEISVRNGVFIAKPRLVDENDGLYSIKDAEYNFVDYAKEVADLEYEQLKNINDEILPDTSCTLNITVDAYLYYDISLLTRINIDNTTETGIYKDSNGFPVSVKSITITSLNRQVEIQADNIKSVKELEELNSQFPDENDDEYNIEATRTLISLKTDMKTRLKVQE